MDSLEAELNACFQTASRAEWLAKLEAAWLEVMKEESAKDPIFKKVADHYLAFRKKYKSWGDAQAIKNTYLK